MENEKGNQTIIPYLIVRGANQFIEFAKVVFGAEVTEFRIRKDGAGVMHAEIMINGSMIMLTDATGELVPAKNSLFIWVEDADATYLKAIQNGATSCMELCDFETRRISGVTDPFGNVWWITSLLNK